MGYCAKSITFGVVTLLVIMLVFFQLDCVRMDMLQLRGEDMYIYIMSKRVVRVKMWSLSVGI